jgi:hypothetical protein
LHATSKPSLVVERFMAGYAQEKLVKAPHVHKL